MSNEEFQKIVLEELKNLREGQRQLEIGQRQLEIGQEEIKKDLKAVIEQTVDLTEFRQEANEKLDQLLEENRTIHGILGEHEVSIRTMRRRII